MSVKASRTYPYYPGCSLKRYGGPFERSALASSAALGIELKEIPEWNCCGTVHGLSRDGLIHKVAPLRNLLRTRKSGGSSLVTLCSICYNTLKRTNQVLRDDALARRRLNAFLDDEPPYAGDLPVRHLLEVLRDDLGFATLGQAVKRPLAGLAASPYYGCMLLRPADLGLDDAERPRVLSDFLLALGARPVESPLANECCGSYQAVSEPDVAAVYASKVLGAASRRGAKVLVASCPLCVYNLDARQAEARRLDPSLPAVPVLYFPQVLGLALGLPAKDLGLEGLAVDPRPALKAAGIDVQ